MRLTEESARLRKYEAMIIVDNAKAATEWEEVSGRVRGIFEKHGAEMESWEKWAERRLAYEVKGHRRGTYLLGLYSAPPDSVAKIRRDCELSEDVVRVLILQRIERKKAKLEAKEKTGEKGEPADAKAPEEREESVKGEAGGREGEGSGSANE